MNCIPLIYWKRTTGVYSDFKNFKLETSLEIEKKLKVKISGMNMDINSENNLVLKLRDEINFSEEEYELTIDENLVEIISPSIKGLSQGLSTIKIMLFAGEGRLKNGYIEDAPKFPNRGVFLDVSRGKMPTIEYLKHLISFMSDLKYNLLQLYCEDKLELKTDPKIGILTGVYTEAEIRELDQWCIAHFIELQPCIQTYSHLHGILTLPEYEDLCENNNLFSMAAGKEEVYKLFEREFEQVLPWFTSKTLNINMDEAYDLGTGYTEAEVAKEGKGMVYLRHIRNIYLLAKKNGIEKVIIWGDIALRYKTMLSMLAKDITVADWNYNPLKVFPSLDTLGQSNVNFWSSGGVSTWNSLFPRVYNTYINLNYYSIESFRKGAKGFLVTDWGDYGHSQPLGLSLYGYMIGAHQSYHASRTTPTELEANIFPLIFHDIRVQEAFRFLMDSNLAPNLKTDFKTMSIYYFFDDLFDGLSMNGNERYPKLSIETFDILANNGREAYERLTAILLDEENKYGRFPDPSWKFLLGENFIKELHFSARATLYTGMKGKLSMKIKSKFESGEVTPKEILAYIVDIKQLYSEFLKIRSEFEEVWKLRANWLGIENSFMMFDKAGVQLGEAVKWLANQYRMIKDGEKPDYNMETYTAGKDYTILWTNDYKNMWERAYPWQ